MVLRDLERKLQRLRLHRNAGAFWNVPFDEFGHRGSLMQRMTAIRPLSHHQRFSLGLAPKSGSE